MRWFVIPKGTSGKVAKLIDNGRNMEDAKRHVLRDEIGEDHLLFDPITFSNNHEFYAEAEANGIPAAMPKWAQAYAHLGFCGVERKNSKGESYVFITSYRNVKVM
jgi:hypothetical protein